MEQNNLDYSTLYKATTRNTSAVEMARTRIWLQAVPEALAPEDLDWKYQGLIINLASNHLLYMDGAPRAY